LNDGIIAGREAAGRLSQFCDGRRSDTGWADFLMLHHGLSGNGKLTSGSHCMAPAFE